MIDPRVLIAANAAEGAALQRQANGRPPAQATGPKLRTGRKTQQAVDALVNLRADIAAGLPAAALLDRIDDELFKIQRGVSK